MSPIKGFTVIYDALNEEGSFSEGDPVAGTVTFTLTKDTKVKSLMVKVKGDVNISFTKSSGGSETTSIAHTRYFKVKKYFVEESPKGTVLPKGVHHFKFRLDIPHRSMPSSFKGKHGKIVYKLEAKISRSWRWPSEIDHELNFVSKSLSHLGQVMCLQSGSVDKEVGVFSKGQVKMSATVNGMVFSPGDTLFAVATICNSSSKEMTPKFSLQQKIEYHAGDTTHSRDKSLWKMVGAAIAPNSEKTVSCHRRIPNDVIHSLYNCGLISVEHYLMVYLDISFAFDPEVKLPLVIIPSRFATLPPGEAFGPYRAGTVGGPSKSDLTLPAVAMDPSPAGAVGRPSKSDLTLPAVAMDPSPAGAVGGPSKSDLPTPAMAMGPYPAGAVGGPSKSDLPTPAMAMGPYPAGAVGAPSYSDFPLPAFHTGSDDVPTAPGAYGYPAPGPTQPGNTSSGYNNQLPQQAPPYSFPAAAFSPPSVQHQDPTAPPLFQQGEDPPAYMSLFHPSRDIYGSNGSEKKT